MDEEEIIPREIKKKVWKLQKATGLTFDKALAEIRQRELNTKENN